MAAHIQNLTKEHQEALSTYQYLVTKIGAGWWAAKYRRARADETVL